MSQGFLIPSGDVTITKLSEPPLREMSIDELLKISSVDSSASDHIADWRKANYDNLHRGVEKIAIAQEHEIPHMYGRLWIQTVDKNGDVHDYGLASLRCVTTAAVNAMVEVMNGTTPASTALTVWKYHALGTGTNAEATSDTALQTELTTQYSTDNTRPTGSQTVGATNNVYRTAATITVDASVALTEHGIFNQAAVGGGILLDRTVFAVVNLSSGESFVGRYDFLIAAGG